jgi:hypothetical protein
MTTAQPAISDLTCVSCGYLLRGHGAGDRCPECGGTVRATIDAQRLDTWPTAWLNRLRRGLGLLVAGVAVGWVAILLFSLATLSMMSATIPALRGFDMRWYGPEWTLALPFLAAFVLSAWGTVVVTFSEAARLVAREHPRAPWLARAGVALGTVAFTAVAVGLVLMRGRWRDRMLWAWLALFAGGAVAVWNLATCLARLARRIPDRRLAQRCETFRWLALLAIVLACFEALNFFAVLSWLPIRTTRGWWRAIAVSDTLILTGRAALLVVGVVAVQLLATYARRLASILRDRGAAAAAA